MLRMSGPYAIAAILLMTVPQIAPMAQAIYVFITYNLMLTVVYTLFQLPFATNNDLYDKEVRKNEQRLTLFEWL